MTSLLRALVLMCALVVAAPSDPLTATAYYIPGATPTFYKAGANVNFFVNSLRSNSVMYPLDYYGLPFCKPAQITNKKDSIGETIWGDRQHNSLYTVSMVRDSSCMVLPGCNATANSMEIVSRKDTLKRAIERGYRGFMNIDNLPVFNNGTAPLNGACNSRLPVSQRNFHQRGYALGVPSVCGEGTLLNNHLRFRILVNTKKNMMPTSTDANADPEFAVVGLQVVPYSVKHQPDASDCDDSFDVAKAELLSLEALNESKAELQMVYWTYSVEWVHSDVVWATRWDAYFHSSYAGSTPSAHFAYMGAALLIVALVAGAVASILMRALRRDIVRYNSLTPEELQEETGWKLVHADVFRPPDHAGLLCIMFGNGAQILCMVGGLLLLSILGLLSPSRRGSLLVAVIALGIFTAFLEGYACGFLQRYLNCKSWRDVIVSGCALQGSVCGVYLLTVIFGMAHGSTTAAPFGVVFLIFFAWIAVSLPLTILGASFAYHQEPLSNPVRVGRLAREIPVQPTMNEPLFLYFVPPLFPMATIIMELHLVMRAMWAGEVYYVFQFMAVSTVLWVIVAALVTVSQLYYVLCYENHRWWWVAFICPGCLGFHIFVYAVMFFCTQMSIQSVTSGMLYFLYMGIVSYGYGLAAGTTGLAAGIAFTRFIYGSIKVD